ncbi:MAG: rod shape-determining protein MreC [Fibrobacteraceae bacterium]|nr:rod shape-determining protein MreC [Fibrobacteraceae bacterium]
MKFFRSLVLLLSKGHGLVLFIFLLAAGLGLRQLSMKGKELVVEGAVSSVYYPAQSVLSLTNRIRSLSYENDSLKKENARLRMERDNLREGQEELVRLRELVHFDNVWNYPIVTARIIGRNPGRFLTTFIVNRGSDHGIQVNMPVFTVQGLVGRISSVSKRHAKVQLLLDPALKLSVMAQRTRVVGFLEGGSGNALMAMIPSYMGVKVGDTLVTSGLGGIFPKGIVIGTVRDLRKGDVDVVTHLEVAPFQEFTRLEELFIMEKEPDWIVRELLENDSIH